MESWDIFGQKNVPKRFWLHSLRSFAMQLFGRVPLFEKVPMQEKSLYRRLSKGGFIHGGPPPFFAYVLHI